jgi:hypothetical protein
VTADTLRRAAALMRERAEATDDWYSAQAWATASPMSLPIEPADAEHIASWHPAVALAVADWLDQHVEQHGPSAGRDECIWNDHACAAIAVALAFLGEDQ